MRLELLEDVAVELRELELRRSGERQVLIGRTQPGPGRAYLVLEGQGVTGVVRLGAMHYDLRRYGDGILISERAERSYPKEAPPNPAARPRPHSAGGTARADGTARAGRTARTATTAAPTAISTTTAISAAAATVAPALAPPIHDLLVVYTQDVEARLGGAAGATSRIALAIAMANDVYEQSGVAQRLRLAHAERVLYAEAGDLTRDLTRLQSTDDGVLDDVHPLRDRHAADLVVMLVASGGDECGKASLAVTGGGDADDGSAFAVVAEGCIGNHSFVHELGHVAGAHHDAWSDPTPLPAYARGVVSVRTTHAPAHAPTHAPAHAPTRGRPACVPSARPEWRTVMSYPDACELCGVACPRIDSFSNPSRTHPDGRPLGGAAADNTRRLNETARTVERFRIGGPRLALYAGPRGTQDHVCVIPATADAAIDFTGPSSAGSCDDDAARSLRLFELPAGRAIRLYDDPRGDPEDDWIEIVAKRRLGDKLVPTLERSFEDADVRVVYHRRDGLDGEVSRVELGAPAAGRRVVLHDADREDDRTAIEAERAISRGSGSGAEHAWPGDNRVYAPGR